MNIAGMLAEAFDRVGEAVHAAVEGLPPDDLNARLDEDANSISWLVWHLTRVQDDHIADASGTAQIWLTEGWADRFALPFDATDTGYGHSSDEVAAVRVDSADPLLGY
ncbi:DinB family protein, partial [Streptomyces sp. SID7982]|nr:DinB family protein [Streptomyces sp. SID7982]